MHQAPVMTCFCSLINTHEVQDAYEKHTWVYSILNKIITAVIHWTKEWVLVFRSWIVNSMPYFGLTWYKEKSPLMLLFWEPWNCISYDYLLFFLSSLPEIVLVVITFWCSWVNLTFMGPRIVNVFLSTTTDMQRYTIFFTVVSALHVSSGFSARNM